MNEEPTVLDYVKSKLKFWLTFAWLASIGTPYTPPPPGPEVEIGTLVNAALLPEAGVVSLEAEVLSQAEEGAPLEVLAPPQPPAHPKPAVRFPWRMLLAFGLGLLAQISLEPHRDWRMGAFLYLMAFLWLAAANWRGEWRPVLPLESEDHPQPAIPRPAFLLAGVFFSWLAYRAFGGFLFNRTNTTLWVLALASFLAAFWIAAPGSLRRLWAGLWDRLRRPQISLTSWALLFIGVMLIAVYFRANLINEIPSQMNSDHAEKLLDVWDVEHGFPRVFFPRNTGREAFQFFLIAATDQYLHTGISFLSMKIGAIAAGLLTLPFIYLIGLEIGNRWVGMWAMAFAGIAYWPNVISRLALRFTFYPFFAAPTLYFLIRGLRRKNQNDLLISGLLLGLGLHSYTPIRILPVVVVVGAGLYMLHHLFSLKRGASGWRVKLQPGALRVQQWALTGLAVITLVAVVGFIPLLRYISNPVNREMFFYRSFTRAGSLEQPLPGKPLEIFLSNTWNAMRMFGWDNGDVWTVSVPHRPALDAVSAALCYLGMGLVFLRYLRKRNWLDLFLLLSIPMLMLPSILSLAFPQENPVPSRTSGAIIPVFLMVGIAMESMLSTLRVRLSVAGTGAGRSGARLYGGTVAAVLGVGLFLLAANSNYSLVFDKYRRLYELSSWNSNEMGAVYKDFATTIGTRDTFWLVGYPYWVDSRLISIAAGFADRDCAIMPESLADTLPEPRAKLFTLHPEDIASRETLQQLYPQGTIQVYESKYATKSFLMFFVPPAQ
jgi:hypothetical protein